MRYYSRIIKKYKNGEIIFSENSECDGMYIIDSGRVRVYKTSGEGANKRDIELCTLGPKAMFGEMAMIDENKRSASVQAIEGTVCTVITKKIFEDQLTHIPLWMVNMIRILVMRLRETNDKLRMIVEQYGPPPVDTGSIITVDEDCTTLPIEIDETDILEIEPAPFDPQKDNPRKTNKTIPKVHKHFRSEDIVKSLFDQ
jgi:CRP-like cAMP-binding protein